MSSREKNNKAGATRINNDDDSHNKELSLTSTEALIVLNEFRKSRCEEDKLFQLKVESLESQIDK